MTHDRERALTAQGMVERLRRADHHDPKCQIDVHSGGCWTVLCKEAANEIERLDTALTQADPDYQKHCDEERAAIRMARPDGETA